MLPTCAAALNSGGGGKTRSSCSTESMDPGWLIRYPSLQDNTSPPPGVFRSCFAPRQRPEPASPCPLLPLQPCEPLLHTEIQFRRTHVLLLWLRKRPGRIRPFLPPLRHTARLRRRPGSGFTLVCPGSREIGKASCRERV